MNSGKNGARFRIPLRDGVEKLEASHYTEAAEDAIRLEGNTNAWGPNPAAKAAGLALPLLATHLYPTDHSDELRRDLAADTGLPAEQILVGNGSDEIFDLVLKAFVNPGERVAMPWPSFSMYPVYTRMNLGKAVAIPLRPPRFALDPEAVLSARPKVVLLASPNNPTGNVFPPDVIRRIVRDAPGVVVVDEAYADFCAQDWRPRVREFPNLLVTRSFSKSYALAGFRVGYAVGCRDLIGALYRVKPPFNVSVVSEFVARHALADATFLRRTLQATRAGLKELAPLLETRGFRCFPTAANFVLAESPLPAEALCARLMERKIVIRSMAGYSGFERFVRVSVGTSMQHRRLARALDQIPELARERSRLGPRPR